jgi:bifunctional NMN adenylyltransferase/nudix hydrolase
MRNDSKFDYLVYLGRFQIPHGGSDTEVPDGGHFKVIETALEYSDTVIIGIGSANRPRSLKNPFTYEERVDMLANCSTVKIKSAVEGGRIIFLAIDDDMYNDKAWVDQVESKVRSIVGWNKMIGLIGCKKDDSSYYINLFNFWPTISVPIAGSYNSTDLREKWLDYGSGVRRYTDIGALTTSDIVTKLEEYSKTEWFAELQVEKGFISDYKNSWKVAPFPVTFNTVDAVVTYIDNIENKYVLLVERGRRPGKGLLALPGGFLDGEESFVDGAIREAWEETSISKELLSRCVQNTQTFGDAGRDPRGRTITHATRFNIDGRSDFTLPPLKAADDAAKAMWVNVNDIDPKQMISDHFFIIRTLTGLV